MPEITNGLMYCQKFWVKYTIVPLGSVESSTIECEGIWCVVKTNFSAATIAVSLASVVRMNWKPA